MKPITTLQKTLLALCLIVPTLAQGQTLLSQTTWGSSGRDVPVGVALSPDGSSYVVGETDSFTVDQFGQPRPAISLVKFDELGNLLWQKVWTGLTSGASAVAIGTDGAVYVSGTTGANNGDVLLLKFDESGNLIWQRSWGSIDDADTGDAVATSIDGSVYIAGTKRTEFGGGPASLLVLKFDASGSVLWQKMSEGAFGGAVAAAPDGNVYAVGGRARPPNTLSEADVLALKMTSTGDLIWDRTYSAGEVVDARGGMAIAPDGVVFAGAIQAAKGGTVGIAPLLVKLDANGNLLFNRQWPAGTDASAVAVATDGSIYMAGTTSSIGAGFQDAFVAHVQANGKAAEVATWGGAGFEEGGGVSVAEDGTVALAASTTTAPPYSLLEAPRKVSGVKSTVAVAGAELIDAAGVTADPGAVVIESTGTTTYGGNFETALVKLRFTPP
jgi:hypothetical protein